MTPGNEQDLALARRAAGGDQAAFAALVAAHERALRGFLSRMGRPEHADDLAQEAFLRAWRFISQYDGRARFSTWLTRIGWRCWIDQERRRGGVPDEPQRESPPAGFATLVSDLLARLPDAERAALILTEGHGWSHVEAAELLGMPLGSLKSRVARAKQRCREMWEGADNE